MTEDPTLDDVIRDAAALLAAIAAHDDEGTDIMLQHLASPRLVAFTLGAWLDNAVKTPEFDLAETISRWQARAAG